MPFLVAAFGRVLLWALGTFVGRVILGLGVGVVAYEGLSQLISTLHAQILAALNASDPMFLTALDYCGFWDALNIIFAAYTARFGTQTAYKIALRRAST